MGLGLGFYIGLTRQNKRIEDTLKDLELTLVKKALLLKNKELEKFLEMNKNIRCF